MKNLESINSELTKIKHELDKYDQQMARLNAQRKTEKTHGKHSVEKELENEINRITRKKIDLVTKRKKLEHEKLKLKATQKPEKK